MAIPFEELKASVALSAIVGRTLRLSRAGRELKGLCPFHAEKTPSFTVNDEEGFYHCFGCGAHGDVFDWLKQNQGLDAKEAAESLGYKNGHTAPNGHGSSVDLWSPGIPPEGEPEPDLTAFDHVYRYTDSDGRLLRLIARKNETASARKQFVPFTWGILEGNVGWHRRHSSAPRSLYGLSRLEESPDGLAVICEGEKAADAAYALLSLPCLTWSGGTSSVHQNDWRSLAGRDVVIWPDNDQPGHKAAEELRAILAPIARSVVVLPVAGLPDKADAADLPSDTPESWFHDRLNPDAGPFLPTSLATRDLSNIAPRRWLYGHELIRGFVTILASPGGVGKSAYTIPVGLSVALGWPLLAANPAKPPRHTKVHAQGAVWFYNLEDPLIEMDRRLAAALIQHKITQATVNGSVYVDSGRDKPLCIGTRNRSGDLEIWPNTPDLVKALKKRRVALMVVDPFIHSHDGKENDNGEMAKMIAEWAKVADQADCAIWLVHHFRKGGAGADPDSIRGAVAIVGAVRSAWTVSTMSADEAKALGVPEDERGYYFRHDNAKQNMAPPTSKAAWYELVSVPLQNQTDEYPEGDHVQAVQHWAPASPWEGIRWSDIEQILETIEKGPSDGEFYAMGKQSKDRWAGHLIVKQCAKEESQAIQILKTWKQEGLIEEGQYASPRQKGSLTGCVRANLIKLREVKDASSGSPSFE